MFFVLSKILGFFAIPSNLVIVLALLGAALACTRFARAGRWLMVGSVLAATPAWTATLEDGRLQSRAGDAHRGLPAT